MVHLWLAGKRVVDVLLVLIEFFSLGLMATALQNLSTSAFSEGVGHFAVLLVICHPVA